MGFTDTEPQQTQRYKSESVGSGAQPIHFRSRRVAGQPAQERNC